MLHGYLLPFVIVLNESLCRKVSCDNHVIDERMTSLRDRGFVNYFGMQRFGTTTIPTYHVGKQVTALHNNMSVQGYVYVYQYSRILLQLRCILQSDWKGAVDSILMPRPGGMYENYQTFMYIHIIVQIAVFWNGQQYMYKIIEISALHSE